jgi:hypothetical protein
MAKLEISKVHDAYAAGGECPLCTLMDAAERTYLASFRGARLMEPSVRVRTNRTGFCPAHWTALYRGENKLGLSLLAHTHLKESLPALREAFNGALSVAGRGRGRNGGAGPLAALAQTLRARRSSCVICEMLEGDLGRYAFTIAYLWKEDPEFRPVFRASRGFCLDHFPAVLDAAREQLRPPELAEWVEAAVGLMVGSLERLEREVLAFTQFLHGSVQGLGSEAERTALARTLQKLTGRIMSLE